MIVTIKQIIFPMINCRSIDMETERDVEKGENEEEEEEEEEEEDNDEEKRRQEEEDNKKKKERQEIMELVHVFIAFAIIIGMAVGIVVLDNVLFPEEEDVTFIPLDQRVHSTIRYTGNGFIPCKGLVPTPADCHFPQYKARMQRPFR